MGKALVALPQKGERLRTVACDISGRHVHEGRYLMVCAAVVCEHTPTHVVRVLEIGLSLSTMQPQMSSVCELIRDALSTLSPSFREDVVLLERGELFNVEQWRASSLLERDVRYIESIGERRALEIAHHCALATRELLLRMASH
ncbi:MAG: Uncharacterized protein XD62_0278 [Methanosarcinales archeaon 56_1174]|nr:MAG: Uncharacterized protein XD62_0278 [Methanosarcinales archeaon 56_1174]